MTDMQTASVEEKTMQSAKLTEEEEKSPIAPYFYREMTHPPDDVLSVLQAGPINPDDALPFASINDLLNPGYLKTENGVEMRSRFWPGAAIRIKELPEDSLVNKTLNTAELRSELIPPGIEKALAFHCAKEYNHLATILPELFEKYGST